MWLHGFKIFTDLYPFLTYAASDKAAHIRKLNVLASAGLALAMDTCDPKRQKFFEWHMIGFLSQSSEHGPLIISQPNSKLHVETNQMPFFIIPTCVRALLNGCNWMKLDEMK